MTDANSRVLVTLVCEALIAPRLTEDLERLGAKGWTATQAYGSGHSGSREGHWENDGNRRIEVVCAPAVADQIAVLLGEKYFDDYHVVCWSSDINVLRPERF